jgi:hypothetical protein
LLLSYNSREKSVFAHSVLWLSLPQKFNFELIFEYLYVDLGDFTNTVSGGLNNCYGAPGGGRCDGPLASLGTLAVTSHFTTNIVRVGLNYQFH